MKILVACEESQAVTVQLRNLGHEAYSCDIQECSGGHEEWHIKRNVLDLLNMYWDMIIALVRVQFFFLLFYLFPSVELSSFLVYPDSVYI